MIELALIFGIFVLSYILILKNFNLFVYVLMVLSLLLHKELFSFYRWDLMPVRGAMLAVLCAGLTRVYLDVFRDKNFTHIKRVLKNPFFVLLLALWLVRGISIIFTKNLNSSLLIFGFFTTVIALIYFLYVHFAGKKDQILKYLDFYILGVFGLTLFGYFQYLLYVKTDVIIGALWNIPGNIPRIGATFWDVNHYGALIASLLPVIGIFILVKKSKSQKVKYFIIFASLFVSLILTNSRTAWIIDGIAFLVFSTLVLVKKMGVKGIAVIFGLLLIITIPLLMEYQQKDSPFRARIKQYFHYRIDSFDSHFMLLTGTYQIFEQYPVFGGGYGSFFEHFSKTKIAPTYFGRDPAALNTRVPAHTIWGELIAETGVLGLSIFILLVGVISATLYYAFVKLKSWRESFIPAAMLSSFIGWMVAGIFYSYNAEFFWIVSTLYFLYGMSIFGESYLAKNLVNKFFKSKGLMLTALILISVVLLFINLGKNHLIPWDEAIYAKISKNMVITNEYLSMQWVPGTNWFEKPPMYMWFMALSMRLLGVGSFTARLPSALMGFSTIVLTYFFAKKMFGKFAGFFAGFALLTTFQFLYYSRTAMTDVTVTFFITLSMYFYYLARENSTESIKTLRDMRWWIFSGLSIGAAIMVKGVVGFLPYLVVGVNELYLLQTKKIKLNKSTIKSYTVWLLSSFIIALPWHIYMYVKFGSGFFKTYIGYHVLSRATSGIEDKGKPLFWYFIVLKVSMRLWFLVLMLAYPLSIFKSIKNDDKHRFLVLWSFPIFLFFSVAKSKLVWYIMPVYPVLSIIVGNFAVDCIDFVMKRSKLLNNSVSKFLMFYGIVVFVLIYLFIHKNLVYTGDLTGSQAKLMMLKDEELGTDELFYLDRIEYPLALFYTDSPFEIMDISPRTGRFPTEMYSERLIILAKRGRFEDSLEYYDDTDIVGEDGDWVLWHYPSSYQKDLDQLDEIEDEIKKLQEETTNSITRSKINLLQDEKENLENKINEKLEDEKALKKKDG